MRGKPRRTAAVACAKRILDGERAAYNRQGGAAAAVRWAEIEGFSPFPSHFPLILIVFLQSTLNSVRYLDSFSLRLLLLPVTLDFSLAFRFNAFVNLCAADCFSLLVC